MSSAAACSDNIIRIATYNIASTAFCPQNGVEAMNKLLQNQNIDLAGIQELDYCNGRHNYDMLGKFLDYGYFSFRQFQKSIDFMDGAYGIGILSRFRPLDASGGPLPSRHSEGRSFARMLVEKDGKQIAFYNTHLSYESEELKMQQMHFLMDIIQGDPAPYKILTGDFNTDQSHQELYPLLERFNITNGAGNVFFNTFNQAGEDMKVYSIDNIVFSSNIRLRNAGMVESQISDHNMLWAELELLPEPQPSRQYLDLVVDQALHTDTEGFSKADRQRLEWLLKDAAALPESACQNQIDSIRIALQEIL